MKLQTIISSENKDKSLKITIKLDNYNICDGRVKEDLLVTISELIHNFGLAVQVVDKDRIQ